MLFNGKTMSVVACFHDDKAVSYAPQALTEEERQQARYNIGVFAETDAVAKLCPDFSASGTVVACEPMEGYPLAVQTDGATKVYRGGKNLIGFQPKTENSNGITYTYKEDGTIVVDGTATSLSQSNVCPVSLKEGVTYTLSGCVGGSGKTYQIFLDQSGLIKLYNASEPSTGVALGTGTTKLRIFVYAGVTVTNLVIKPQLEIGSVATEHELYREPAEFAAGEAVLALDGVKTIWADKGDVSVFGKADPVAIMERQDKRIAALEETITALLEG